MLILTLLACPGPADLARTSTDLRADDPPVDDSAPVDTAPDDTAPDDTAPGDTGAPSPCEATEARRVAAADAALHAYAPQEGFGVDALAAVDGPEGPALLVPLTHGTQAGLRSVDPRDTGDVPLAVADVYAVPGIRGGYVYELATLPIGGETALAMSNPYADGDGAWLGGELVLWTPGRPAVVFAGRGDEAMLGGALVGGTTLGGPDTPAWAASAWIVDDDEGWSAVYRVGADVRPGDLLDEVADAVFVPTPSDFGYTPALAAVDMDGDGVEELAVGASWDGSGGIGQGRVWLLGPGESPEDPTARLDWGELNGAFGANVWAPGDLDGDGHAELAVGAPQAEGAVLIYTGPLQGASDAALSWATLTPGDDPVGVGAAGAPVGDLDGDGRADLLVSHERTEDGVGTWSWGVYTCVAGGAFGTETVAREIEVAATWFRPPDPVTVPDVDGDDRPELAVPLTGFDASGSGVWVHRSSELWAP